VEALILFSTLLLNRRTGIYTRSDKSFNKVAHVFVPAVYSFRASISTNDFIELTPTRLRTAGSGSTAALAGMLVKQTLLEICHMAQKFKDSSYWTHAKKCCAKKAPIEKRFECYRRDQSRQRRGMSYLSTTNDLLNSTSN
jgi:hypothetical protein